MEVRNRSNWGNKTQRSTLNGTRLKAAVVAVVTASPTLFSEDTERVGEGT